MNGKYLINGKSFSSQKQIKEHFRGILIKHNADESICDDDLDDCLGLFERHPEWEQKRGCGIADVRIVFNPVWGDKCFWLIREDGSSTDISYLTCVSGKNKTGAADFAAAARVAVVDQITAFKRNAFKNSLLCKCELTGKLVTKDDCEVDHEIEFRTILSWFVSRKNLDLKSVEYVEGDGQVETAFKCQQLLEDWQAFHREHAKLRIASTEANRAREVNRRKNGN